MQKEKKIELRKDGVKIGGRVFRVGDILEVIDRRRGDLWFKGVVRFGKYIDVGDGRWDKCHLGFVVEDTEYPSLPDRYTLIDVVENRRWKVRKVKE